jgi:hypothetical protein
VKRRKVVEVGELHLVFSSKIHQQIQQKRSRYPYLPDPARILYDFQELSVHAGVPAAISQQKGKTLLLLYTSSYYVAVSPSEQGGGYVVYYVEALNLREHDRLAEQGVFWLRAASWYWHARPIEIPKGKSNYWRMLCSEWQAVKAQQEDMSAEEEHEGITPTQESFLNALEDLVRMVRDIEQATQKLPSLIPYRLIESAGEQRYTPRDCYLFHLAYDAPVSEKMLVRLKEVPDLQGQIIAVRGNTITVKFHGMIDRTRIPPQGRFEPTSNSAVFRTQIEAIALLRKQQAKSLHLLRVLVDQHYQPYRPAHTLPDKPLDADEPLDEGQLAAFQHALTVPDMLLVLGPPGTGKTRTITEIVRFCSTQRQRVLVTSRTHKAVDNVLERLPESNLLVVRIGHEDRVSERIRPKLLDEQAAALQATILQETEMDYRSLAVFIEQKETLEQWLGQISVALEEKTRANWHLHDLQQRSAAALLRVQAPFAASLAEVEMVLLQTRRIYARWQQKVAGWTNWHNWTARRVYIPLFGWIFSWLTGFYKRRIEWGVQHIAMLQSTVETRQRQQRDIQHQLKQALDGDAEYRRCEEERVDVEKFIEQKQQMALTHARRLQGTLLRLTELPGAIETLKLDNIKDFLDWYCTRRSLLESRAALLRDWRKKLESRHEQQLTPELIRYADIVGATCIGIATAKGVEEIEFDVAIVDEAGQVGVPDLLVPLVRAKRAVLVGDHHQLPPFVHQEVKTWLRGLAEEDEEGHVRQISTLITKSAFEQLFPAAIKHRHLRRLIKQRRMPESIANFVAQHFYEGQLRTVPREKSSTRAVLPDPLFTQQLVFIDTSSLPFRQRQETYRRAVRGGEEARITNDLEANLIADLVTFYDQKDVDWVVIVPYRAQAQLIVQKLNARESLRKQDIQLEDRVATVDSFQGRENDLVIYGFTRSNAKRKIGFLDEVRRLNVAMTRAKKRLILVGDLMTLTTSEDVTFNHLVRSLKGHIEQQGELLIYEQYQQRLRMYM